MDGQKKSKIVITKNIRNLILIFASRRILLTLKFNYRHLIILFLFVFGIYGWGTFDSSPNIFSHKDLLMTSVILTSMLFIYFSKKEIDRVLPTLRISILHLTLFISFLLIGTILNFSKLQYSLTGDELYYARQSQLHSIEILFKLKNVIPSNLLDQNSAYILRAVSIAVLIVGLLFLKILLKLRRNWVFISVAISALILTRQAVQSFNPNNALLSPLPSLWYYLTSTILGFNSFVYRFSTLILYCILASFLFYKSSKMSPREIIVKYLTIMLLFTIPLINSLSLVVEPANMTFLTAVATLFILIKNDFIVSETLIILLSASFYLRMNNTFLLAAVILTYLTGKSRNSNFGKLISYSFFIILPGLLFTYISRVTIKIHSRNDFLGSFKINIRNSLNSLELSHGLLYAGIAIVAFAFFSFNSTSRIFIFYYGGLSSLLFLFLQFPNLSGSIKYSAEYLYPLVIMLPLMLIKRFSVYKSIVPCLIASILIVLNVSGIIIKSEVIKTFREVNAKESLTDTTGDRVLPNRPFPYRDIFMTVKSLKLSGCLNSGVAYGIFPEIQSGFTLRDVFAANDLRDEFLVTQAKLGDDWRGISLPAIKMANLRCIIIGDVLNQSSVVNELTSSGWRIVRSRELQDYGTKVFLMYRE